MYEVRFFRVLSSFAALTIFSIILFFFHFDCLFSHLVISSNWLEVYDCWSIKAKSTQLGLDNNKYNRAENLIIRFHFVSIRTTTWYKKENRAETKLVDSQQRKKCTPHLIHTFRMLKLMKIEREKKRRKLPQRAKETVQNEQQRQKNRLYQYFMKWIEMILNNTIRRILSY